MIINIFYNLLFFNLKEVPMNNQTIIHQYLKMCKHQKHLSSNTIRAYYIDLTQLDRQICHISFAQVSAETINAYIQFLHHNYKAKSIKRKIASSKALFKYLFAIGELSKNPWENVFYHFRELQILPRTIPLYILQSLLSCIYS